MNWRQEKHCPTGCSSVLSIPATSTMSVPVCQDSSLPGDPLLLLRRNTTSPNTTWRNSTRRNSRRTPPSRRLGKSCWRILMRLSTTYFQVLPRQSRHRHRDDGHWIPEPVSLCFQCSGSDENVIARRRIEEWSWMVCRNQRSKSE